MTTARNSRFLRTISLLVITFSFSLPAQAQYSGGTGDPNDPYQIATAEDLMLLGESPEDYDKHFILTADIDLDPNLPGRKVFDKAVIAPVSYTNYHPYMEGTPFDGIFDGDGHTISHLTIIGKSYLGLFGQLSSGAIISNLGLEAVDVNGDDYIGALVGYNASHITNSYITGTVSGYGMFSYVGGLVGRNSGHISKSYNTGTVSGYGDWGDVGGLLGFNDEGEIINCYSASTVSGDYTVGGLVGYNKEGLIINSYSKCTVIGGYCVGGLAGVNYEGDITNSYSNSTIHGNSHIGGLVGNNVGDITKSYSTSTFSGYGYENGYVNGLVGNNSTNKGSIIHSIWDIEASGLVGSDGYVGLTTTEMMDPYMLGLNGFANDPNWVLDAGLDYPRLAWEGTADQIIPEPDIDWLQGEGTLQNPYRIDTAEQLILLGKSNILWDKHFLLGKDIDLDPNLPKVNVFSLAVIPGFSGVFEGNGHKILHLTIKGVSNLGLIGRLESGGVISNMGMEAVDIEGIDDYLGGLVGYNNGHITNTYSTGTVSGDEDIGGLVGNNNHGDITNSYSTCAVSGDYRISGLVGNNSGYITKSYSTSTFSGYSYDKGYVNGLVGTNRGSIIHCMWDIEASGLVGSDGYIGLTTAEMMDPYMLGLNGFANDPNWVLDAGLDYPRLAWEGTAGQIIPMVDIDWLQGEGTSQNPYKIDTAEQLILLGNASILWDKHFFLGTDIDLDPNLPNVDIFSQAVIPGFTGVFDGNGYKIFNPTINGVNNLGLFGRLGSGAVISNLGLEAIDVKGTGNSVGGLAAINAGYITSSYSTGIVSGNSSVGGFVGNNSGRIINSYSIGTVSGRGSFAGGLVGTNGEGDIINSYSNGTVSGSEYIGGLVGNNNEGDITNCYRTGIISGNQYVGGLVGVSYHGSIVNSYSTGKVSGYSNIGGLVGLNQFYCRIISTFWDIETSGQTSSAGGIGKTTAELQDINTYLNTGWDFAGESLNGIFDCWQISPGEYPKLPFAGHKRAMPEGLGTAEEPYLIRYAGDIETVWFEPTAHYRLETSIDLAGITWSTAVILKFGGSFDGNGHTISHLNIQGSSYLGLIGQLESEAMIFNLGMEEVDINGTGYRIGSLVGNNYKGSIFNCYSTGNVHGSGDVGGLVGVNSQGNISNCYNTGKVSGGNGYIGGLVSRDSEGNIKNCYNTGIVSGTWIAAGLVADCWGGVFESSFWDVEASGRLYGFRGTGKTTAEMQTAVTFLEAGWDFVGEIENGAEDIWWINEGQDYPRLWWEAE